MFFGMFGNLHKACAAGDLAKVRKLLKSKKFNLDAQDKKRKWPLQYAVESGNTDLVRLLIQAGAPCEPRSFYPADPDKTKILVEAGADVNAADDSGWTPLHRVADSRLSLGDAIVDAARILLDSGANPDATDDKGKTPLHSAAESGHVNLARLLIGVTKDIDAKDNNGQTALHKVIGSSESELRASITKALLDAGADLDGKDIKGKTPRELGERDIIRRLMLSSGATPGASEEKEGCRFFAFKLATSLSHAAALASDPRGGRSRKERGSLDQMLSNLIRVEVPSAMKKAHSRVGTMAMAAPLRFVSDAMDRVAAAVLKPPGASRQEWLAPVQTLSNLLRMTAPSSITEVSSFEEFCSRGSDMKALSEALRERFGNGSAAAFQIGIWASIASLTDSKLAVKALVKLKPLCAQAGLNSTVMDRLMQKNLLSLPKAEFQAEVTGFMNQMMDDLLKLDLRGD